MASALRRFGTDSPACCRLLFDVFAGAGEGSTPAPSVGFCGAGEGLEAVFHMPTMLLFRPLESFSCQHYGQIVRMANNNGNQAKLTLRDLPEQLPCPLILRNLPLWSPIRRLREHHF